MTWATPSALRKPLVADAVLAGVLLLAGLIWLTVWLAARFIELVVGLVQGPV